MSMKAKLRQAFARWDVVKTEDPDGARRGHILNLMLLILIGLGLPMTIAGVLLYDNATPAEQPTLVTIPVTTLTLCVIYGVNRTGRVRLSVTLFVLLLLLLIPFADTPQQVAYGRSTILFAIPIVAASLLLAPAASFAVAGLSVLDMLLLSAVAGYWEESLVFTAGVLLVVATVSWLASRSLEYALAQVRANEEQTRSILDSITDGVLALEVGAETAVITAANPAAAPLLQQADTTTLIGGDLKDILGAVAPEDWLVIQSALQQQGAIAEWQVQLGRTVLQTTVVPLRAARSQNGHSGRRQLLTVHNATREAEVQRLQAEITDLLSHGINTPLGIMEMLATELRDQGHASRWPTTVTSLLAQINDLKQTVSDLLDRDQLSRRRLDVDFKEVSLPHCLAEIEQSVRAKVAAQRVTVVVKYLPLSPDRVTTDVRLLVQAGRNLVYHLLAQTPTNEIKVRVGRKDPTHWLLHVTDYSDESLPYGPLLPAQTSEVAPQPTVNWLLAEQVIAALQGELQVGRSGSGRTLIQAVFEMEPRDRGILN